MRLTWLADALRAHGLRVVEVSGWKTRGSTDFDPIGMTWHATAGSRNATAQGEVNVILNGSTSAPPPIAQLMIWRDGTIYVCAAGRCNHNLTGWGGPNQGLGNSSLLGIEMANDNRGEPWPSAQLDAARRATAVIMKRLGANPMKRLAAHFEHQPGAKTDPLGVDMKKERPRVAILISEGIPEGDDMPTVEEIWAKKFAEYVDENGNRIRDPRTVADVLFATHAATLTALAEQRTANAAILAAVKGADSAAIMAAIQAEGDKVAAEVRAQGVADAARDDELRSLIEQGANGELDAQEVLRLMGERLAVASN